VPEARRTARRIALWAETAHGTLPLLGECSIRLPGNGGRVADARQAGQPTLMALPSAFDGFVEHSKRVSPTCLITFERNRYSVPASFANRPVSLRVYPDRLVIVRLACLWHDVAEGRIVCEHPRIIERSHRKPGGDREMVDIRRSGLVLQHDEQMVLRAVEMALEAGVPTKTHILNLLHRLVDRKTTDYPEVDPPDALALRNVPQVGRPRPMLIAMMTFGIRRMNAMRHDLADASIVIMLRSLNCVTPKACSPVCAPPVRHGPGSERPGRSGCARLRGRNPHVIAIAKGRDGRTRGALHPLPGRRLRNKRREGTITWRSRGSPHTRISRASTLWPATSTKPQSGNSGLTHEIFQR